MIRVDLDGNLETVVELPEMATALGWTPESTMLLVSANDRRLLRLEGDELVTVADMSHPVGYPLNAMVIDAQGRAYIGNLGYDFGNVPSSRRCYSFRPTAAHVLWLTGWLFPMA